MPSIASAYEWSRNQIDGSRSSSSKGTGEWVGKRGKKRENVSKKKTLKSMVEKEKRGIRSDSPANEFVTSTRPPDPTSPSRIPTTRFLASLATRVWWSTTDRSTRGWTVTSEGVARAGDDGVEDEVVGAEPPPSPLAASVVIVAH